MPEQLLEQRRTAGLAVMLSPPADWMSSSEADEPPPVDAYEDELVLPEAWLG